MATMEQLNAQIAKLQAQRDVILQQVNNIEKQEVVLRKQQLSANDAQKTSINNKLTQLAQQKMKLTGTAAIQKEDVAPAAGVVDGSSAGGNPNAPMGANGEVSTSSIGGKFPKKFSVGKRKDNTGKVFKFVDRLGSKGTK